MVYFKLKKLILFVLGLWFLFNKANSEKKKNRIREQPKLQGTSWSHLFDVPTHGWANLDQVGQGLVKSNSDCLQEWKLHGITHAKTLQQSICFSQNHFTEKSQPGVPATNTVLSVAHGVWW